MSAKNSTSTSPPAAGLQEPVTADFLPMTPAELAASLGVQLSQRGHPDLSVTPPTRFVTLEEAKARGMSWYYTGEACRYGDQAARRTSNPGICSDCQRRKQRKNPVYPKSRAGSFYEAPRRAAKDPTAPVIIAAPAPAAPPEPSKKETEFLAAAAEHGDLEKACTAVGWPRAQMEARYSINEVFRKAVDATLERLQIPRTLKAPSTFAWTDAVKQSLISQFVDTGLLHTAREAVGVSASEFFAQLDADPGFAAAIETARPRAVSTLRDRATQAAAVGKIDLLKYLETNAPKDDFSNLSPDRAHQELTRLIEGFVARGIIPADPTAYIRKSTGETIEAADLIPADEFNNDLIGGA